MTHSEKTKQKLTAEGKVIDRWVPQSQPNGVYCSPACGFGCTQSEYDHATVEAAKLAALMGGGWAPRVWENLGWHWSVTKGVAEIHPSSKDLILGHYDEYTVYFNTEPQIVVSAKSPEGALGIALQKARGIQGKIAADCAALLD